MRRHERVSALKECLAAIVLIQAGWKDVTSAGTNALSIFDLVVGFAVLGVGVIELKRGKKFGSWVRWFDIAVGGLMALEGLTLATEGQHHKTLIYGYYGLGAFYVLLGVFHAHLGRRRYVRMDDDGVQVRMTPFRSFRLGWPEISRVVGHADSIEVFAKGDKRYEVSRRYVPNLDEIRQMMLDRASGRGIATQ
ncbi:MAG TPA: hypothetical protein VEV39_03845 [Gemmatimonadales bacterium]|nr:hypothetical protein [Gemmatimonadales bacterium]